MSRGAHFRWVPQRPDDLGFTSTTWTVPLMRLHIEQCAKVRLSDDTLRRRLHALGFVWKRPRYVLESDPEREKKTPELNPMEHLWRYAKQRVCATRQYPTIDSQLERFLQHVYSLENHEALKKAGVLSKRFWLRSALSRYFCGPT